MEISQLGFCEWSTSCSGRICMPSWAGSLTRLLPHKALRRRIPTGGLKVRRLKVRPRLYQLSEIMRAADSFPCMWAD